MMTAEKTQKFVQVSTDFENNSEDFWNAVFNLEQQGNEYAKLLRDTDTIVVTEEEAEEIRQLVESLPDWDAADAPTFAPHPIIFNLFERDFREEGYDSFNTEEGTEPADPYAPSDYADFPEMSERAKEVACELFNEGHGWNQSEWRNRCESIQSELSDLFEEAYGEPLKGEAVSAQRLKLTDKVYGVRVTNYFPVTLDYLALWDGSDDQNPEEDDGTLEQDLQSFADDSSNSDEARAAVRGVLEKLRTLAADYSNKSYSDALAVETAQEATN